MYRNDVIASLAAGYNDAYAENAAHFKHSAVFAAITRIDELIAGLIPRSCIYIGCGQGQLLEFLYRHVHDRYPESLNPELFMGVDVSEVAINQCENKYPEFTWVVDTFQGLLAHPLLRERLPYGVDLIVNKGGLTKVSSEDEYERTISSIKDCLSENGLFLYMWSKRFYRKWISRHTLGWKRDPIRIMFDILGQPLYLPDDSRFIFCFAKGRTIAGDQLFAKNVTFEFLDGRQQTIDTYYDHQLRERVALSVDVSHRRVSPTGQSKSVLATNMKFVVSASVHAILSNVIDWNQYSCGHVSLLFDEPSRSARPMSRIERVYERAYEILRSTRMLSRPIVTSRSLIERVYEFCRHPYEHILLGGSFSDWLLNLETDQTKVDPDEFEARIDWCLEFIRRYQPGNISFLTAFPLGESDVGDGSEIYSAKAAIPFKDALHRSAAAHDVSVVDITPVESRGVLPMIQFYNNNYLRRQMLHNLRQAISDLLAGNVSDH